MMSNIVTEYRLPEYHIPYAEINKDAAEAGLVGLGGWLGCTGGTAVAHLVGAKAGTVVGTIIFPGLGTFVGGFAGLWVARLFTEVVEEYPVALVERLFRLA